MTLASILGTLVAGGVEFVVIGSAALEALGESPEPVDLDIVPRPTPANLVRLRSTFDVLGLRPEPVPGVWTYDEHGEAHWESYAEPADPVLDPADHTTFDRPFSGDPGSVDVVLGLPTRHGELATRASIRSLWGVSVPVAHPDDLLVYVTTARREKDRRRLAALRRIQARLWSLGARRSEALDTLLNLVDGEHPWQSVTDDRPSDRPIIGRVRRLLATVEDPFDRTGYHPGHITASGFVIHPSRPAAALVHHAKLGIWVQPGGHVEADDPTLEGAARREIAEEIGPVALEPLGPVDVDVHTFPARGDQPQHLHFDLRWGFRAVDDRVIAGDGVVDVRWVPFSEMLAMDSSLARPAAVLTALLP